MRVATVDEITCFTIDGGDVSFVGISQQTWNGWECPLFFADQLGDMLSVYTDLPENEKSEAVEFFKDAFDTCLMMVNGFPRLMVAVGYCEWCWDETKPEGDYARGQLNAYRNWVESCDTLSIRTGGWK